jgi:hypothetical protein
MPPSSQLPSHRAQPQATRRNARPSSTSLIAPRHGSRLSVNLIVWAVIIIARLVPRVRARARARVRGRGRRRAGTRIESSVGRYAARSPNRSQPRARRQRRFRQYSIPSPQPSPMRILFRFCCTTAATCGRPSPPRQRLSSLRAWCQGVRRICDVGPSGECWSPPDTQGSIPKGR